MEKMEQVVTIGKDEFDRGHKRGDRSKYGQQLGRQVLSVYPIINGPEVVIPDHKTAGIR